MKIEIFKVLQPEMKIASIKTLRFSTGCGLKEAKELVDDMVGGALPKEVEVMDEISPSELATFGAFFDYTEKSKQLHLYLVIWTNGPWLNNRSLVLASDKDRAGKSVLNSPLADALTNEVEVTSIEKVEGPFSNGHILFSSLDQRAVAS